MIDLANYTDSKRTLIRAFGSMAACKDYVRTEIVEGRLEPGSRCRLFPGAEKGDGWAIERQPGHVEPDEQAMVESGLKLTAAQERAEGREAEATKLEAQATTVRTLGVRAVMEAH